MKPKAAYLALLTEHVTSTRTHFSDFRIKFKKEPRFKHFGRDDREREKVFRTYLRDLGERKRKEAEAHERSFRTMLEEATEIVVPGAKWADVS
jgi:transcription elongation regulator 1